MTSNGRILIVEDDVAVREMLGEYLRTHGYEVVEVDRGVAMREAVESALPDVVLLDVNLPGEDGFTLARFLRERYDAGIIIVSAATEIADRSPGSRSAPSRVRVGACSLDLASHQLFAEDGGEVSLTNMEFDLLKAFIERPNQLLYRDQLLTLTRNREWEPFDRSIDIRIARLRRKIEPDPEHPETIRTARGAGYMYVPRS